LIDLAEDLGNLTDVAHQVLRDEMKKRKLTEPGGKTAVPPDNRPVFGGWNRAAEKRVSDPGALFNDSEGPVDYTWKTLLCDCVTSEQVLQVFELLGPAGIEAWSSGPSSYFGSQTARILVAADQLEKAKQIIARPIPQDIADRSREKVEDFEPPTCPKMRRGGSAVGEY
jgi:hypothetical protein